MTPHDADRSASPTSDGSRPAEAAQEKTRAFLGEESAWKKARLRLGMAGPPGYPGLLITLVGNGRLKDGKTDLPPVAPAKLKEVFDRFIEEAFTEIDVGNKPGVPGEIVISLEISIGLCRRHRLQCFASGAPPRFTRLVDVMRGLVQGPQVVQVPLKPIEGD